MPRTVAVNVTTLAAAAEAIKRVTPRGTEDGDHLHHLVEALEDAIGYPAHGWVLP
jgi:hypothetical protein